MTPVFSLAAAVNALHTGSYHTVDSVERRASNAIADQVGPQEHGMVYLPKRVLMKRAAPLTVSGTAANGGNLSQTSQGSFYGSLQPYSTVLRLGATQLSLKLGITRTPVVATPATPVWQTGEAVSVPPTSITFDVRTFTPRILPISITVSRQLLQQSDADDVVIGELLRRAGAEFDRVVISGDGASGRPTGIVNTAGVNAISGTTLADSGIVAAEQAVSDASAVVDPNSLGFVTTPAVAALLKQRPMTAANLPIWKG